MTWCVALCCCNCFQNCDSRCSSSNVFFSAARDCTTTFDCHVTCVECHVIDYHMMCWAVDSIVWIWSQLGRPDDWSVAFSQLGSPDGWSVACPQLDSPDDWSVACSQHDSPDGWSAPCSQLGCPDYWFVACPQLGSPMTGLQLAPSLTPLMTGLLLAHSLAALMIVWCYIPRARIVTDHIATGQGPSLPRFCNQWSYHHHNGVDEKITHSTIHSYTIYATPLNYIHHDIISCISPWSW